MPEDIEARIAKIEKALRKLKTEVRRGRRKNQPSGGPCLVSLKPNYDSDEVHRRKLRRRDLRDMNSRRMGDILGIINSSMQRMEPDGLNGVWSILKHNRDLILTMRVKALE